MIAVRTTASYKKQKFIEIALKNKEKIKKQEK